MEAVKQNPSSGSSYIQSPGSNVFRMEKTDLFFM